jgi:preprotein translocase subunit SecA
MTPDPREPDHDRASARGVAEYHQRPPAPRLAYLMGVLDKLLRVGEGRKLKALQGLVPDINSREAELQKLSDADLRARTGDMRQQLDNGADLDDLLIDAFAVVREAASRTIGQRHYDVQMMGGAALHFGWVAEMKTGEGKTLVSTLPVYLNGLTGQGRARHHRERLPGPARRRVDGPDPRVAGSDHGHDPARQNDPRLQAGAVRVRHHLRHQQRVRVRLPARQHGHHPSRRPRSSGATTYAIVDEVDSILIDEARTPLIISGRVADAAKLYYKFASIVRGLKRDVDYDVDEEKRIVAPTEEGSLKVEAALGLENLYDAVQQNLVHQFQAALKAKELYKRDKDYIIQHGEVKIVDEFTGRILEGRRWSEGLHQAVEAKEGVKIKEENQTLATITLQNYFRMYDKLAGMTGTAVTEAAEFASTYNLQVVPIPTHRTQLRIDQPDLIYKTEDAKFDAVVDDLAERYETGQPVLVGTISVEKSEKLPPCSTSGASPTRCSTPSSTRGRPRSSPRPGRLHSVTVATNMAGRGVDILLGGNPEGLAAARRASRGASIPRPTRAPPASKELTAKYKARPTPRAKVRELGGLYVLGTERHESRRIDNQLRGRSGRQGDPGESRFYLSLEDELMRLFATGAMNWVMGKALPDDVPIEAKMVTKAIERAQNTVEQRNAEIRKNVLKYDEVMNEQRKVIYKRRDQILEDADLRAETLDYLEEAVEAAVATFCVNDIRRGVGPRRAAQRDQHLLAHRADRRAAWRGRRHRSS